jgi:hypothetical protein
MKIAILCLLLVVEATAQEVAQSPFQFSANGTNGCTEAVRYCTTCGICSTCNALQCTILVDRFGKGQTVFYREPQSLFTGYGDYYSSVIYTRFPHV